MGGSLRGVGLAAHWTLETRDVELSSQADSGGIEVQCLGRVSAQERSSPLDFPQEVCIGGQCHQ